MAGPQLQLVLRCSQMAAPLDALPYWAEPRLATPWQPIPKAMILCHGMVRVGHIETRLTSITLLFLLVFCWFPWTDCRITWSILSSAPHYPGHYGRGKRSNRSRTSDGDSVLSDMKISRSTGNEKDWGCGSTSICRIGGDMSKAQCLLLMYFMPMRASSSYAAHATHVQAHVRAHVQAHVQAHVCYMNWYDRYLHRKLCAHVRKKVSKQVITSQTRTFSDHAIMSHSADQNPWDFKMNGCRLKIWPLLRGTSRCPCRPCIDGTQLCNKPLQNANANCLHMDMGMPWVHGALRVGHIETRLTSITLLFLLVFCWFPWTDCRITWSILIYLYYFIQKCPTLSRSLWKRQAEQQISHLRRRQCLVRYEDLKINGEWERLRLWFHINMSDRWGHVKGAVSTFDVFHANASF